MKKKYNKKKPKKIKRVLRKNKGKRKNRNYKLKKSKRRISKNTSTLVRVQQSNLNHDLLNVDEFGSRWSISDAMKKINKAGNGIILLIDGDGNKENEFKEIRASKKKRKSTPNNDPRRIGIGSQILRDLGVKKIKLMGSEVRYPSLSGFDLEVTEYIKK